MNRTLIWLSLSGLLSLSVRAETAAFEGAVTAALVRGGGPTNQLLFTRSGDRLRIEIPDPTQPNPVNVIELDTGRLTILYPHNSTFVRVAVAASGRDRAPGEGNQAADVGAASPPRFPAPVAAGTPLPQQTEPIAPAVIGPQPPTLPLIPPVVPPIPARPGAAATLQKADEQRTIHGWVCRRYVSTNYFERLEVWATDAASVFPFHLLEREYSGRSIRSTSKRLDAQWVALLKQESLFPLEATLRDRSDVQRLSFRVIAIERKKTDGPLFAVPKGFREIQPPPF